MTDIERQFKEYCRARDKAVASMDVDTFKAFASKYSPICDLPKDDEVIEITMRKMAVHITSLDIDTRVYAFRWLLEHGYDFSLED